MPILYVNGRRRGKRVSGHAVIRNPVKKRARKSRLAGAALAAHLKKLRAKGGARRRRKPVTATTSVKRRRRGRKARRNPSMAKKRRVSAKTRAKLSRKMKARWRARRAGGKVGRMGRTKRRRARKAASAPKRRRRRARKAALAPKRRRRRGKARKGARRGRRRRGRRTVRMSQPPVVMLGPSGRTIRANPGRRRRRRRSYRHNPSRRRYSRRRRRRSHRRSRRRYRRSYRRNPGNMIIDLAKRAVPVFVGVYGTRFVASKLGSLIPGVSSLGSLTQPAMAVATMVGVNFLSRKVSLVAKHKTELMLGSAFTLLDSLFQAFAPASVKGLVGMSDYVQMGDYLAVGGVPPINDSMTLSDYLAVGGDGVSEELGLEEELGVEEELGNDLLGGMSQSALMKRVPTQAFMTPVPARSFTRAVPGAGSAFDNPNQLYTGIFSR